MFRDEVLLKYNPRESSSALCFQTKVKKKNQRLKCSTIRLKDICRAVLESYTELCRVRFHANTTAKPTPSFHDILSSDGSSYYLQFEHQKSDP